jgi:hypothetical protein
MGGGELLIMTNPRKRRSHRRRSRSRAKNRRSRNPFLKRRTSRRHSRRRNPAIGGFSSSELLKLATGSAVGSIGTGYLTQLLLADKNTGPMGYGATAAIAIALAWAAKKVGGAGDDLAKGVLAGGLGALLMRIYREQVSGTSPAALSGYLGDLDFAGGLGRYEGQSFATPFNYQGPTALPAGAVSAAAVAGAASRAAASGR